MGWQSKGLWPPEKRALGAEVMSGEPLPTFFQAQGNVFCFVFFNTKIYLFIYFLSFTAKE